MKYSISLPLPQDDDDKSIILMIIGLKNRIITKTQPTLRVIIPMEPTTCE